MKEKKREKRRYHWPQRQNHLFFIKGKTKRAFFQAAMVSICMLVCLLVACITLKGFLITSLAASAFIAFAFPRAESSRPKYLIGGYICGFAAGLVGNLVYTLDVPFTLHPYSLLVISCAVGAFVATLLMVLFGVQHPPAAALAVSLVFDANPLFVGVIAMGCILLLCLIKYIVMHLMMKNNLEYPAEEVKEKATAQDEAKETKN
ncbi:HPP family protein [Christensenellaceae bacterium OttesenSCG-928-K19]|nr:HPP family protein [Christensenellaceae bacterium OttesenSCG-928-K19]